MAKTININYITKIEGHAKLHIKIDKGKIKKVALNIFDLTNHLILRIPSYFILCRNYSKFMISFLQWRRCN